MPLSMYERGMSISSAGSPSKRTGAGSGSTTITGLTDSVRKSRSQGAPCNKHNHKTNNKSKQSSSLHTQSTQPTRQHTRTLHPNLVDAVQCVCVCGFVFCTICNFVSHFLEVKNHHHYHPDPFFFFLFYPPPVCTCLLVKSD